MPVPSQEYDGCFPVVSLVDMVELSFGFVGVCGLSLFRYTLDTYWQIVGRISWHTDMVSISCFFPCVCWIRSTIVVNLPPSVVCNFLVFGADLKCRVAATTEYCLTSNLVEKC